MSPVCKERGRNFRRNVVMILNKGTNIYMNFYDKE